MGIDMTSNIHRRHAILLGFVLALTAAPFANGQTGQHDEMDGRSLLRH
jgi:hypothetical protein